MKTTTSTIIISALRHCKIRSKIMTSKYEVVQGRDVGGVQLKDWRRGSVQCFKEGMLRSALGRRDRRWAGEIGEVGRRDRRGGHSTP